MPNASSRKSRERWSARRLLRGSLSAAAVGAALASFCLAAETVAPVQADANGFFFDPSLFRGGALSQSALARFNRVSALAPATYKVDLFVNNRFATRADVPFVAGSDGEVAPCFTRGQLEGVGVAPAAIRIDVPEPTASDVQAGPCTKIENAVAGAGASFDQARLRLDLNIPQASMRHVPRGQVPPSELVHGDSVFHLNYFANAYHAAYDDGMGGSNSQNSAYLALNGGLNLGAWRFRQQSYANYQEKAGTRWRNTRLYAQRAFFDIGSALTAGQSFTTGRLFSGLAFTGANLATDDRMQPDSMRGYAPTVHGTARTNARVSVRQNGNEIYQTTVAPGPFEISDLYPTNYNGDLEVLVTEADGTVSQFTVPYAAVPQSLRPGLSRYDLTVGRTRNTGDETLFGDFTYQRGLSNTLTANGGLRLSEGYQAVVLGGAYNSPIGAFGLEATYSHAEMPDAGSVSGWMGHLSYSRTFQPTATTVSIAGYRYSTSGYRDLGDVLGVRYASRNGSTWQSSTFMQRARFEVSINQNLGDYGSLYLSGSTQDYRDGRRRDTQLQAGYSTLLPGSVSVNLSVARVRTGGYRGTAGYDDRFGNDIADNLPAPGAAPGSSDTMLMLSFSIPLGKRSSPSAPTLDMGYSQSQSGGSTLQADVSGTVGADQSLSYGVGATHEFEQGQTIGSANLQKRFPTGTVGGTASIGKDFWQVSANAQGALAIHGGGITFGPYLSDTFALIEAKGAEGARLLNGLNTTIDSRGYALMSSLTPYRYNFVSLDPQGMDGKAELEDGERRIAPYAGAAVKVVFKTRSGNALLIRAGLPDGTPVPMGSEVLDETGNVVGIVGQNGQAYLRAEKPAGSLSLRWGEGENDQCSLSYDLSGENLEQALIRLQRVCSVHP